MLWCCLHEEDRKRVNQSYTELWQTGRGCAEQPDGKYYRIKERNLFNYTNLTPRKQDNYNDKKIYFNHWEHSSDIQKDKRKNSRKSHAQEKRDLPFSLGSTDYTKINILTNNVKEDEKVWTLSFRGGWEFSQVSLWSKFQEAVISSAKLLWGRDPVVQIRRFWTIPMIENLIRVMNSIMFD